MSEIMSKSAVNKLGERLRAGEETEETLRMLDDYREMFAIMARELVQEIEAITGPVNERTGKTTQSIIAKLQRQPHLKLAQMQDIAGARVIVETLTHQNEILAQLQRRFLDAKIDDKRSQPGYRAVHIIFRSQNLPFELQVRTPYQHTWAQNSEALASAYGIELKYGKGPEDIQLWLRDLSNVLAEVDEKIDKSRDLDSEDFEVQVEKVNKLTQYMKEKIQ